MTSTFDMDFFPGRDREMNAPMPPVQDRPAFLDDFAQDFDDGQHLTAMGPTQRGKSRLVQEMLKRIISPERQMTVLIGKPPGRERTWSDEAAEKLNLRVLQTWNQRKSRFDRQGYAPKYYDPKKINGYLLRPQQSLTDIDADNQELTRQFHQAIVGNYSHTKRKTITVVDEGHHVQVDLKLKKICEAPLMRGAPDNSMWTLLQRSRFVSYLCYDAPEHILVFRDDDKSNQERYSEIGGVDARYMYQVVKKLKTYRVKSGGTISQALYFRRKGSELRIVDI